jgi:3-hydroxybutyryl-CoA dehydrogenase
MSEGMASSGPPDQRLAVAGAGRIGSGIALAFAYAGFEVALIDLKPRARGGSRAALEAAGERIANDLEVLEAAGVTPAEASRWILRRICPVEEADANEALRSAGVVFEATPELRDVKRDALARLEQAVPRGSVIASATSSFLVDELAAELRAPERFLNAHWLNPAHLIPVVEVSPGRLTSSEVHERVCALLRQAGKVPVVCAPSPGYIVPRVQALAMNEAARLIEDGVATPEAVDAALRLGLGVRFAILGMLEFIDWGGADTLLRASQYLRRELGSERFAPPDSVVRMSQAGRGAAGFRGLGEERRREALLSFVALLRHLDLLPEPRG